MAATGRLEDLELSFEEAERFQRAFRDERFRALFAEYAAELADPEQRRLYEEEVAALERERGIEVRFVHPAAGYVLRTSQAGSRRCYLNVCSNPHVAEPQAHPEPGGYRWALPFILAPVREELGRSGQRRLIYDVVFHPAALRLAARSARFRRLLSDTALQAVERHCSVQLDRANATVLRGTKYKGVPQAPVIRTPLPGGAPLPPSDGDSPLPPFPFPPTTPPPPAAPPPEVQSCGPTTPRWSIRHRCYVDLQDYRYCRDSAPSPVPRELVVTVELPLLRSAAEATLEIRDRELRLDSQRPAYRLRLRLPYDVNESGGRASFNKAQRQLVVTLPVLRRPDPQEPLGPGEPLEEAEPEPGAEGLGREPLEETEPEAGAEGLGREPLEETEPEAGAERLGREPLEEAELRAEGPGEPAAAEAGGEVGPVGDGESGEPSLAGDSPSPRSGAASPSPEEASLSGEAFPCTPESLPRGDMEFPRGSGSAEAAMCPPFQCRQDEVSLTLLLHVPGIQPQSLSGNVDTNHYSLRFSSDSGAYALFLQFPPTNMLVSPEASVSVSTHNAAIGLTKSPGNTGLWEKFSFGLDSSALQERLFVSEENIAAFLDTVLCPSFSSQSTLERQPLIEALDFTEDRIQISLKPQEAACSDQDGTGTMLSSSGGDPAEEPNSNCPQTKAETNCTTAETSEGDRAAGTSTISTPSAAAETMGKVGCSSHYCLQHEPSDMGSATPDQSTREEPGLNSAVKVGEDPMAMGPDKQAGREGEGDGDGGAAPSGSTQGNQHNRAPSPALREVSTEDGSMQVVRVHARCCPFVFQNDFLYDLD